MAELDVCLAECSSPLKMLASFSSKRDVMMSQTTPS